MFSRVFVGNDAEAVHRVFLAERRPKIGQDAAGIQERRAHADDDPPVGRSGSGAGGGFFFQRFGERDAAVGTDQERRADPGFQRIHVFHDRCGRDEEFFCGSGKAAAFRHGEKDAKLLTEHGFSSLLFT